MKRGVGRRSGGSAGRRRGDESGLPIAVSEADKEEH